MVPCYYPPERRVGALDACGFQLHGNVLPLRRERAKIRLCLLSIQSVGQRPFQGTRATVQRGLSVIEVMARVLVDRLDASQRVVLTHEGARARRSTPSSANYLRAQPQRLRATGTDDGDHPPSTAPPPPPSQMASPLSPAFRRRDHFLDARAPHPTHERLIEDRVPIPDHEARCRVVRKAPVTWLATHSAVG